MKFSLNLDKNDNIKIELLESDFYGRILFAKNTQSQNAEFFDLDLLEPLNTVFTQNGLKIH